MGEIVVSRRDVLIGLGAGVVGGVLGAALRPFEGFQLTTTDRRDVMQASGEFLELHQTVINGLGDETEIETSPNQIGKRFKVDDRQYTLLLEKDAPNTAGGYKRILEVERAGDKSLYAMYDSNTVYREYSPTVMLPLNIAQIDELSTKLTHAFSTWSTSAKPSAS